MLEMLFPASRHANLKKSPSLHSTVDDRMRRHGPQEKTGAKGMVRLMRNVVGIGPGDGEQLRRGWTGSALAHARSRRSATSTAD